MHELDATLAPRLAEREAAELYRRRLTLDSGQGACVRVDGVEAVRHYLDRGPVYGFSQTYALDYAAYRYYRDGSSLAVTHQILHMRAEKLDFPDAHFDKLYGFHVIQQIPDIAGALGEVARVLRPGGRALFVVPWEPVRGLTVLHTALMVWKNPLVARQLQCHKLGPRPWRKLVEGTALEHERTDFTPLLVPQFCTTLRKR